MSKKVLIFSPCAWEELEEVTQTKDTTDLVGVPLSAIAVPVLLDKEGYDIRVISGAEMNYMDKVLSHVDDSICVGITSMTGNQITQGVKVAKAIKKKKPAIKIIWGGYHPSLMPEQTASFSGADAVVEGYGERAFYEIVKAIEENKGFEGITGVTYSDGDKIIKNSPRALEDINDFPSPAYHLIDVEKYLTKELGPRTVHYITSRGCPYNCQFCADVQVYERKWNALDPVRVIDDFEMLKERYNVSGIRINDSEFFTNEKRIIAIFQGVIDRKINIKWGRANGTIRGFLRYKPSTWELLMKSGLHSVLVGAESGYDKALARIKKKQTMEELLELSKLSRKYKFYVHYSFMFGIPIDLDDPVNMRDEVRIEILKTLQIINKLYRLYRNYSRVLIFRYTVYPGGEFYNEIVAKGGYKEPKSLEEWAKITLWHSESPWLTPEETELIDELIFMVRKMHPSVVSPTLGRHREIIYALLRKITEMKNFISKTSLRKNGDGSVFYPFPKKDEVTPSAFLEG